MRFPLYVVLMWSTGIALVVLAGLAIRAGLREQREWERYAVDHHCVLKATKSGAWVPDYPGNGAGRFDPDTEVFLCDGAEVVVR